MFDLHSEIPASRKRFDVLMDDQIACVTELVDFVKINGDAVVAALKDREDRP